LINFGFPESEFQRKSGILQWKIFMFVRHQLRMNGITVSWYIGGKGKLPPRF
jgi:hypothetical protein